LTENKELSNNENFKSRRKYNSETE